MKQFLEFIDKQSKIIFGLSLLILIYWILTNEIDVYQYPAIGAIYELLWLPFLVMFFVLPILNSVMVIRNKFSFKKLWLYALLTNGLTVLYLYVLFG